MRRIKTVSTLLLFIGIAFLLNAEAQKEVEAVSRAKVLKRSGEAWNGKGRIIGDFKNAPMEFTLELYKPDTKDKPVFSRKFNTQITVFETDYMPAGEYILKIKADKYKTLTEPKFNIEAATDSFVTITFGTQEIQGRP